MQILTTLYKKFKLRTDMWHNICYEGLGEDFIILYLIRMSSIIFIETNAVENSIVEPCFFHDSPCTFATHPVQWPWNNTGEILHFILFQNIYTFLMLAWIVRMLWLSKAPNHHFQLFSHVLPKGIPTHDTWPYTEFCRHKNSIVSTSIIMGIKNDE